MRPRALTGLVHVGVRPDLAGLDLDAQASNVAAEERVRPPGPRLLGALLLLLAVLAGPRPTDGCLAL